jgi:hypothetical protein
MSNPKPNLKAILKDICTTERCLGVLRQTSAYFNERGNSLLTESLRDNPGPAIELLGYFPSPKSFLGSTLAGTVGAFTNTISELDGRANTCRGVVQAELEVLLEQADGEGLQEDRDTANECLATCDKVNTAARDEYRQQLPLCIESLSMTLMLVPEPPMALRMLLEKLAGFAGILLEFELASVDNPTRTEIPLLACLRECQKLQKQTAGDLRAVASERITAATLMLERYRNTIRIVLATIDSYVNTL